MGRASSCELSRVKAKAMHLSVAREETTGRSKYNSAGNNNMGGDITAAQATFDPTPTTLILADNAALSFFGLSFRPAWFNRLDLVPGRRAVAEHRFKDMSPSLRSRVVLDWCISPCVDHSRIASRRVPTAIILAGKVESPTPIPLFRTSSPDASAPAPWRSHTSIITYTCGNENTYTFFLPTRHYSAKSASESSLLASSFKRVEVDGNPRGTTAQLHTHGFFGTRRDASVDSIAGVRPVPSHTPDGVMSKCIFRII
ncbi:hypothetical protein B0H14DRAFT_3159713, partial [Mycena olivaceomarginata]